MKLIKSNYDPMTGFTEEFWYEGPKVPGGPGRVTIRRLQDVSGQLSHNREVLRSHVGKKPTYTNSDGFHKIAQIPLSVLEEWMSEGFNWFQSTDKQRRAKLNDRDFRDLLVRPGKL